METIIIVLLVGGYGFGGWKFWRGFRRTNFEQSMGNRIRLALLWPALFVANSSYRRNFKRALRGR